MAGCIDNQTLLAYAAGSLGAQAAESVEAHLTECRRCAETVARAPVNDELVVRIRELERARPEIEAALSGLAEVQQRVTSTLFGLGA